MTDLEALAAEVAAIDGSLQVTWDCGVCVLHGPKDRHRLSTHAEVQAMRLVGAFTPAFVFRADLDAAQN